MVALKICFYRTMFPTSSSRRKWTQLEGMESSEDLEISCVVKASKYALGNAFLFKAPAIKEAPVYFFSQGPGCLEHNNSFNLLSLKKKERVCEGKREKVHQVLDKRKTAEYCTQTSLITSSSPSITNCKEVCLTKSMLQGCLFPENSSRKACKHRPYVLISS